MSQVDLLAKDFCWKSWAYPRNPCKEVHKCVHVKQYVGGSLFNCCVCETSRCLAECPICSFSYHESWLITSCCCCSFLKVCNLMVTIYFLYEKETAQTFCQAPAFVFYMDWNDWNSLQKMKVCWKFTHPQAIQGVDEFVSFRFGEIYNFITCSPVASLQWMGAVRMRI